MRDWSEIRDSEMPPAHYWRLGQVMDTKFGTNVSNKMCYWILQNGKVTAITVFELLRENQQEGLK